MQPAGSLLPAPLAGLEGLEVERARLAGFKASVQRVLQRLHLRFVFVHWVQI